MEMVRLDAVPALAAILRSGGSIAQEQAAAAVASVTELVENQNPVLKANAVPALVQLLKNGTLEAQVSASRAIGNLATRNTLAQEQVYATGGVKKLLSLLSSGKPQEHAARAVARLAAQNASVQAEVCKEGGIAALLALLSGIEWRAQTQAAAALAELAQGANGKSRRKTQDAVAKAGGIGPLLQLVESRYAQCAAEAVHAIAQVAKSNRANQVSLTALSGGCTNLRHWIAARLSTRHPQCDCTCV